MDTDVQAIRDPTARYRRGFRMTGMESSAYFLDAKPHHSRRDSMPHLDSLLAGARAGCSLCAYIRRKAFNHYHWYDSRRTDSSELLFSFHYAWIKDLEHKNGTPLLAELVVKISPSPDDFNLTFNVHNSVDSTIPNLEIFRQPIDPSRLSERNVQRIQQWANDDSVCVQGWNTTNYVPKRLLDLRSSGLAPTSNTIDPVLIQTRMPPLSTSFIGERCKYVALSYCWGSSAPSLVTETQSLKERLRGIPIDTMPPCFQDAIEVVRALGVRYLWIDALCIVQDDTQDWQVESGSMCDIFSNAFVTIGVASTASCHDSFLRKPLPRSFHIPFRSTISSEISGSYSLREPLSNYYTRIKNLDSSDSIESKDGIKDTSEHYYGQLPLIMTKDKMENWWYDSLVKSFLERRLTKRTDRLPAISGLAKRASSVIGTPYLAGHWFSKESFAERLLWIADYCSTFEDLFQDLTSGYKDNYIGEIVDCRTSPVGLDSTGAVSEGILIVNGKLKKVPARPSCGGSGSSTYIGGRITKEWAAIMNGFSLRYNLDWIPNAENGDNPENPEWHLQMLPLKCSKSDKTVTHIKGLLLFP
ncbi:heterokaryon incompatibility protein-domain-containing protein [Xylaria grammica]|nr:heterokaryon incompatibility protein-domain-containing protein [Xylaria grammica]